MIYKKKCFLPDWILPLLSGIFIGTSYIPFPPWASLFCFVPLWLYWSKQNSLRQVITAGCITAFVFTLIGFNWVTYLLHEFAHLNWFFSVIGMLFFALLAHLYVPVAGLLWFLLSRWLNLSNNRAILLMVLSTVLCEHYSLTLFDWNFGYTWYAYSIPIYQLGEWVGFSGLSALTILFNLPLLYAWKFRHQYQGKVIVLSVLLVFAVLNGIGVQLKNRLPEPDRNLKVLLVQGNIGNEEKLAAELGRGFRDEIIFRYFQLTDTGLQHQGQSAIDFMIWPEAAFPSLLGDNVKERFHARLLSRFIKQKQRALITGAFSLDETSRLIGNSLFIMDKKGALVSDYYTKSILLAFGEYIPGENWFPQIRQWLPPIGQFKRGGGAQVIHWNDFAIGAQICYEGLFPDFSRELAQQGAQFIVNLTNDSWYGSWQEPYQHFYMTLARAIEFRRPVVRATNTGISSVSLANGDILQRSPLHQQWTDTYTIPYINKPIQTFYQQWFYLLPGLLWVALMGLFVEAGWRNFKISRRKKNTNPL